MSWIREVFKKDNWRNVITGVGVKGKDKRTGMSPTPLLFRQREAELLYGADDMARTIISRIPRDAVRAGFDITSDDLTPEEVQATLRYMENTLHWKKKFVIALQWARLYGGAAILPGIDDGGSQLTEIDESEGLIEPLNEDNLSGFVTLTPLHRYELNAQTIVNDPMDPEFGLPENYNLTPDNIAGRGSAQQPEAALSSFIDRSRVIRFEGLDLPRHLFQENDYWGDSVLSVIFNALRNHNIAYDSIAVLMSDCGQSVFKVKDLADLLSAKDGKTLMRERLEMVDYSRSQVNGIMIDQEEEWERATTNFTEIANIMDKFDQRIVQASGIPHTILLGESAAAGLGDKAQSQVLNYYDFISAYQEEFVKPPLTRCLDLLFASKDGPTNGKVPESYEIMFEPLFQETKAEVMENRKAQAEVDQIYFNMGAVDATEVRKNRFVDGNFNFEMSVDMSRDLDAEREARFQEEMDKQSAEADAALQIEKMRTNNGG